MANYTSITADELFLADDMIKAQQSFKVIGIKNMTSAAAELENKIEKLGLTCRVYTENRFASLGLALIPTGVTQLAAIGSAVGMLAHNIVTFNPNYELAKNLVDNSIKVICKK